MAAVGLVKKAFTLLLVDSDQLMRAGLARLIAGCAEQVTIQECTDGVEAVAFVRRSCPDIVVMSASSGGVTDVESVRKLFSVNSELRLIILVNPRSRSNLKQYVDLGVLGFITRNSPVEELCSAIATVLEGQPFIAPSIATRMAFAVINNDMGSPFDELSPRELEIILLMLEGRKNQEIAASLFISEKTVSTYRSRAFNKLEIKNPTDLTLLAVRYGLIDEEK